MAGLKVFISYSRSDLEIANQLVNAIQAMEISTSIDREGISGAEDWRERLKQLISEADSIIFVLSPSSATSEMCHWEVEESLRLNKRIIPVLVCPLGDCEPHPQLRKLNYIYLYAEPRLSGSGFGSGMLSLGNALREDVEWIREHTRLGNLAVRWDNQSRPIDSLARGSELLRWQKWRNEQTNNAPALTDLQREFLSDSEAAEAQRQSQAQQEIENRQRMLRERESAQEAKDIALQKLSRRTKFGIALFTALIGIAAIVGYIATQKTLALQDAVNVAYIRSKYAYTEANYALGLIQGFHVPPFNLLRSQIEEIPEEIRTHWQDLLQGYQTSIEINDIATDVLTDYGQTLKLVSAQEWATSLEWTPGGSGILPGRIIMANNIEEGEKRLFFDVERGELLTGSELEAALAATN